jgi:HEAT repeat protein
MAVAKDPWKAEKAALKSKDALKVVNAAKFMSIQDSSHGLRPFLEAAAPGLVKIALDPKRGAKVRADAIDLLVQLGAKDLKLVAGVFVDAPVVVISAAARALRQSTGTPVASTTAVTRLIEVIDTPGDWSPQYDALRALPHFADPRVVPSLLKALGHAQQAMRREAINGLGAQGATAAIPQLIERLKAGKDQEITAAARALAKLDAPEAAAALKDAKAYARALKQAKDFVAGRFAVGALCWFTVKSVEDDLVKLAGSQDPEVAQGAAAGLVVRQAQWACAPLAERALRSSDPGFNGMPFLTALLGVGGATDRPEPAAVRALAKVLSSAKPGKLSALLPEDDGYREGQLERLDATERARLAAWVRALTAHLKDPALARRVTEAFAPRGG